MKKIINGTKKNFLIIFIFLFGIIVFSSTPINATELTNNNLINNKSNIKPMAATPDELDVSVVIENVSRPGQPLWAGDTARFYLSATNKTSSDMNHVLFYNPMEFFDEYWAFIVSPWDPGSDETVFTYQDDVLINTNLSIGGVKSGYGFLDIPAGKKISLEYFLVMKENDDILNGTAFWGYNAILEKEKDMVNTLTVGGDPIYGDPENPYRATDCVGGVVASSGYAYEAAAIDTTKTAKGDSQEYYIKADERISYTITAENKGKALYNQMKITDTLNGISDYFVNPGAEVVIIKKNDTQISGSYTVADLMNGNIIIDVASNDKLELTFSVLMKNLTDLNNVDSFLNNQVVTGNQGANASIGYFVPDFDVSKEANKICATTCTDNILRPGDKVEYRINVTNNAPMMLKVPVIDPLTDIKSFFDLDASVLFDNNIYIYDDTGTQIATWTWLPDMWNGGYHAWIPSNSTKYTMGFTLIAKSTIGTGDFDIDKLKNDMNGQLTNVATIYDNLEATTSIAAGAPIITVDKAVKDTNGDNYAAPDEKLFYKIIVNNNGTIADDIKIKDPLTNLLPYIVSPDSNQIKITYLNNDSTTTIAYATVSDLINGLDVTIQPEQQITIAFDLTMANQSIITSGLQLTNTVNVKGAIDDVNDSITIETTDKSIVVSGLFENNNGWYIAIVVSSIFLLTMSIRRYYYKKVKLE